MPEASPSGLPQPGQLLLGKYRVDRVLGEGGMGVVLAATHVQLNERVAIKLLLPELGITGLRYARFVREARAASSIRSEHVVRVYDLGALENGAPYIAMEFLSGMDLASVVASRGALPVQEAVDYVLQACEGLAEAHARQIVHRDLKPANLFLTRRSDGSPCIKVLDFGISKIGNLAPNSSEDDGASGSSALSATVDRSDESEGLAPHPAGTTVDSQDAAASAWMNGRLTRTRGRLGSPRYMSPEQTRSAKSVDVRADIWALGAILYELLTGTWAFDAEDADALAHRICTFEPPSVRAFVAAIPEALGALVRKCLAKIPEERFVDVAALALALTPFGPPASASSAVRAARILRRSEGGSSIPAPPVDALAPTEDVSKSARSGPLPARRGRLARLKAALAVASALVVVVLGALRGARIWLDARADRSAAETSGSRMSSNPDAVAAYEAGLRALRDGSLTTATTNLDRAVELDPAFAAAHLGRAFVETVDWSHADVRVVQEHLRDARAARVSLGERDQLLLDAIEPWASVTPDFRQAEARLRHATSVLPMDPTLRFALALTLDAEDSPSTLEAVNMTLRLDSSFALAWDIAARLREVHDIPGAIEAENECISTSPGADTCLWRLARIESGLGQCKDLETTIHRILVLTPHSAVAYQLLAGALASEGAPFEAVRFALEERWANLPAKEQAAGRLEDEAALAIWSGALVDAAGKYEALEQLVSSASFAEAHFPATYGRMLVDLELGRKSDAVKAAEAYLSRLPAWSTGLTIPRTLSIYALQRRSAAISQGRLEALREKWLAAETARRKAAGLIPAVDFAWTIAYAQTVETKEEALAALARRDATRPFFEVAAWQPEYDEWIGRAYLLAGRWDDAIFFLERASQSCAVLARFQTLFVIRATGELGEALESSGDTVGACRSYRRALLRWGDLSLTTREPGEAGSHLTSTKPEAEGGSYSPLANEIAARVGALHCAD